MIKSTPYLINSLHELHFLFASCSSDFCKNLESDEVLVFFAYPSADGVETYKILAILAHYQRIVDRHELFHVSGVQKYWKFRRSCAELTLEYSIEEAL